MPVIRGERAAVTAEELMRSRYCAFVTGDIDWIMASHHPETVGEIDRDEVEQWSNGSDWLGLKIRSTRGGGIDDADGEVDFRARYRVNGQVIDHVEHARFERADGAWRFHSVVDRVDEGAQLVPVTAASSVGRNDPCPCGSRRKYKKCCGA